jgi:endonuclease III
MKLLRKTFMSAPRDAWESCLPTKDKNWYEFAVLLLMLCSSVVPDARLVPAMKVIFSRYEMTPEFVLLKFKSDPTFWENELHDLGRQVSNAENWVLAAKTTQLLGRVPRNYTQMMLHYQGVGPKIALVTIHSSYGDVVSISVENFNSGA